MRNLTKASREASRAAQFQYLNENGYKQETYKGLEIFTHPEELLLKVYNGTAANHSIFYKYRTEAQMLAKVQEVKNNYDRREQYKAEQKEKNKGYKSSHAAASAAIKEELKKAFPTTKFSVTSEIFAGGNSVDISWTNGPTTDRVKEYSNKYQYGHFNGMEDIYEYTNSREDIPQVKYVSESRILSDEIIKEVATKLQEVKTYTEQQKYSYNESPETEAKQLLYQTEIPFDYISLKIVRCDNSSNRHPFKIVFETEQQPEQPKKQPTRSEPQPTAKSGKIQVVDYSEKAIAVIGETKQHKDKLKELGGSFNPRLSCGAGWIFSKKRLEDVKAYFLSLKTAEQDNDIQNKENAEFEQVNSQESQIIEQPKQLPTKANFDTPEDAPQIEYFRIIWHEGRQIDGATFENATFENWEDVQKAFYILWQVNEQGQGGGYTKVKCEIKQPDKDTEIFRVDITDDNNSGDFNPSTEHIVSYISHF